MERTVVYRRFAQAVRGRFGGRMQMSVDDLFLDQEAGVQLVERNLQVRSATPALAWHSANRAEQGFGVRK
jgi:hypothetical protein